MVTATQVKENQKDLVKMQRALTTLESKATSKTCGELIARMQRKVAKFQKQNKAQEKINIKQLEIDILNLTLRLQ